MNLYSIIIGLSVFILSIFLRNRTKNIISEEYFWKIFFYTTVFATLGAKLFHILENINFYIYNSNLIELQRGFSILGAVTFGYLTIIFFEKTSKLNLDVLKIYLFLFLPLIQSIGRFGNISNNELMNYAPYEIILNLIHFGILFIVYKFFNKNFIPLLYFIFYGFIRLSLEIYNNNLGFLFFISIIFIIYGFLNVFKLRLKV